MLIKLQLLSDIQEIRSIQTHPKIFKYISDDLTPEDFIPDTKRCVYLGLYLDETLYGCLMVEPVNSITASLHFCILPQLYGHLSEIREMVVNWLNTTKLLKVIAFSPVWNKLIIKTARQVGMKEEGRLTKSFLYKWKLHDQIIFGATKAEWNSNELSRSESIELLQKRRREEDEVCQQAQQ